MSIVLSPHSLPLHSISAVGRLVSPRSTNAVLYSIQVPRATEVNAYLQYSLAQNG